MKTKTVVAIETANFEKAKFPGSPFSGINESLSLIVNLSRSPFMCRSTGHRNFYLRCVLLKYPNLVLRVLD